MILRTKWQIARTVAVVFWAGVFGVGVFFSIVSGCRPNDSTSVASKRSEHDSGSSLRSASASDYTFTQLHMAMPVRVTVFADSESTARTAARAAFERVKRLEKVFSDYREDSEINRLCRAEKDEPFPITRPVSPELYEVLVFAKKLHRLSGGAFDPTAGPLIKLWRHARKNGKLPSSEAIDAARSLVDFSAIELEPGKLHVRILRPNVELDFGAVAKGYIVDQAAHVLCDNEITRFCIEAGGDFRLGHPPPHKSGWTIDVPFQGKQVLSDTAISVSGDTSQFVVIDGVRYSHVVDARTGQALTNRVMTVVTSDSAMISDGLATTGCIMDLDEFREVVKQFPRVQFWREIVE